MQNECCFFCPALYKDSQHLKNKHIIKKKYANIKQKYLPNLAFVCSEIFHRIAVLLILISASKVTDSPSVTVYN